MMRIISIVLAAFIVCLSSAHAAVVSYTLTSLGGSDWSAEFSVTNDTLGAPIEEFTIFFPVGDYENISIAGSPSDWDGLAIDPDPGIPDNGFADWLALGSPLGVGETLSGFVATFTYLGSLEPGDFFFTVIDPVTFATLESGVAALADVPTEIPLPGAMWLFVAGLFGLLRLKSQTA